METYVFWNNKGGTGKTSLVFQSVCRYAELNPDKKILAIDLCPQANLSELMLGGQQYEGNSKLLAAHGKNIRCSIGGYFDARLPSPFTALGFNSKNYILNPFKFHKSIPENIDLICGDPLLELQAIAMNTLANASLPGVNTWLAVINWLKDLIEQVSDEYDIVFLDTNPSFSMYTQIALAAASRVILPVMADDSSRRAVQNALSLIYGIRLPSPVYEKYTFSSQMHIAKRPIPKVHLIVKNRITQYMGDASAYSAVLSGIDKDLNEYISLYPQYFTFDKPQRGLVSVRDFQTTGVVAFAHGCPFSSMPIGKLKIGDRNVQVKKDYKKNAFESINSLVSLL